MLHAVCSKCGDERHEFTESPLCHCGGILVPRIDFKFREGGFSENYPYLDHIVSLGEVQTPLVRMGDLQLKLEYYSPTYSYKDRGSRTLISHLATHLRKGAEINEDSSGNAGASISAYGAAAGFAVNIFVLEKTKAGKVDQIRAYGANIHKVSGSREDVAGAAASHSGYFASHVLNPEFRDGMRQISYEIFRQLDHKAPARLIVPVSAGTLLLGLISGFEHLLDSGETDRIPEIVAVQTEAVCPLCADLNHTAYDRDRMQESVADALVSRRPPLLPIMEEKMRELGICVTVSEGEIIQARSELASRGFYVEYSSATVLAAAKKIPEREGSVLILTGNGLKTP